MYRILLLEGSTTEHSPFAMLCNTLAPHGFQTISSYLDTEAFQRVQTDNPDVILLDATVETGFQLCQKLKQHPKTGHVPIFFVHPGSEVNGTLSKSFECGASDFITTNTPESEFLARLKAAIRTNTQIHQASLLSQQLNRANSELYERNAQVEKELYTARQLQQSLLPPFLADDTEAAFSKCHYKDERLRITGLYIPCDSLGGDMYDVIRFPNGTIGVAIADVSGHGVPAGFITAIFKSSFYRTTHSHSKPGDILFHMNNEMADIVKTGEYVTALYGLIQSDELADEQHLQFSFSGAGHPFPLYYNATTQKLERPQENGTPLVWFKNMEYPTGQITLAPHDKLLFFTDGVTEMRNAQGALYGEEALEQAFLELVQSGEPQLLDALIQRLSDYTEGHPLEDDLSMVLIEVGTFGA